jgi:WD repeat-containing protein 48
MHRGALSIASHHSLGQPSPANEQPPIADPGRQAREEYEVREEAADALPLRLTPSEVVDGLCGLVSCDMLNDRRHVLTADKQGDIALWDIVLGLCLGGYARDDIDRALGYDDAQSDDGQVRRGGRPIKDALELVRTRIEGEAATAVWATVDVRSGGIGVHLEEARVFDGEHYADTAGFADFLTAPHQRVNLGKTVLRALFDGFIEEELRLRAASLQPHVLQQAVAASAAEAVPRLQRPKAPLHISLADLPDTSAAPGVIPAGAMSIALATPAITPVLPPVAADQAAKLRSRDPSLTPIPQSPALVQRSLQDAVGAPREATTPRAIEGSDYFSAANRQSGTVAETPLSPVAATPSTGGSFMGRLKGFGRRPKGGLDTPLKEEPDATAASGGGGAPAGVSQVCWTPSSVAMSLIAAHRRLYSRCSSSISSGPSSPSRSRPVPPRRHRRSRCRRA